MSEQNLSFNQDDAQSQWTSATSQRCTQSIRKDGWENVSTLTGNPPSERSLHAAAVLNDSMFVFGGYDGLHRVNDFYEFHFPSNSWREIVTTTTTSTRSQLEQGLGATARGGGVNPLDNAGQQQQHQNNPVNARITASGTLPSPRDRHAAVVHGSSFYVFGGFDGTSRVCDLYGYDFTRSEWREVRPTLITPAGGQVGQPANPASFAGEGSIISPPPSPRHSHAAVVYRDSMYVFGGYDGSYRSDFHEFNFETLTWKPVVSNGRSPRARYRSTATCRGDMLILFGGHDGTRHLSDVHLFDFVNQSWSLLVANGVPPLPRDSHVSVVFRDSMYVFGGSTGSAMNDLYELNLQSTTGQQSVQADTVDEFSRLHARNGPEEMAGGGPAAVAHAHDNMMAASAKWRQIPLQGGGNAVHRFCHVGAVYKGSFYVFGGYDGSSRLNDFVKYDIAAESLLDTDIPGSTILSDLRSFLDDEEVMSFADITLMVDGIPVRAHKLMLMRCSYFRAMLLGDLAESSQTVINIELVSHPTLVAVLEYLYTDTVAINIDSAMDLFVAADCFDISRLQAMCERRLLESMTVENSATIFHTADIHSATSMRGKALAYILSNFETVSKTDSFEEMARNNVELVFEILKSR